jgi:hypothetical protein
VQTCNLQHTGQTGLNGASAEESFRLLEAQIKDLHHEVAFSSVKIGVTTFTSHTQKKAWMDKTNCLKRLGLFFLDTMALLALMHSGSASAADAAMAFALVMKKVGYSSTGR